MPEDKEYKIDYYDSWQETTDIVNINADDNQKVIFLSDKELPAYNAKLSWLLFILEFISVFACTSVNIFFSIQRFLMNTENDYLISFLTGGLISIAFFIQLMVYKFKRINIVVTLRTSIVLIIVSVLFITISILTDLFVCNYLIYAMALVSIAFVIYIFAGTDFSSRFRFLTVVYCISAILLANFYALRNIRFNANYFFISKFGYVENIDKDNRYYYYDKISTSDYENIIDIFSVVANSTIFTSEEEINKFSSNIKLHNVYSEYEDYEEDDKEEFVEFFNLSKYNSTFFKDKAVSISVFSLKDEYDFVEINKINSSFNYEKVCLSCYTDKTYPCKKEENKALCIALLEIPKGDLKYTNCCGINGYDGLKCDYLIEYCKRLNINS